MLIIFFFFYYLMLAICFSFKSQYRELKFNKVVYVTKISSIKLLFYDLSATYKFTFNIIYRKKKLSVYNISNEKFVYKTQKLCL